jgi:hypothetical protein
MDKIAIVNYDHKKPFKFPVNKLNSIDVSVNESFKNQLTAKITGPSGRALQVNRANVSSSQLKLSFQSEEIGMICHIKGDAVESNSLSQMLNQIGIHRIDVEYANVPIVGSPFEVKFYDASRVTVSDVKSAEINKPCEFLIDAGHAGEGQLEISINDGTVKNHVKPIKSGQYLVSFVPTKPDYYVIDCKFNGEYVTGTCLIAYVFSHMAENSSFLFDSILHGV